MKAYTDEIWKDILGWDGLYQVSDDSYIQIDRQIKTGIITKKVKYIWKTI